MGTISPQQKAITDTAVEDDHTNDIRLEIPTKQNGNNDAKKQQTQNPTQDKWWKKPQNVLGKAFGFVKWILLIVAIFIVLAVIASWNMNRYKTYSKQELQQVHSLVLYAAKSAEEAERVGRTDPMQGLLNANYAVCYVNAAKHMVNEETLESLVGTSMVELEQYLTQLQHTLLQTVLQQCEAGKLTKQSQRVQNQTQQRQTLQTKQQQNQRNNINNNNNNSNNNTVIAAEQRQTMTDNKAKTRSSE